MESMSQGILNEALKHKLIFIETPDAAETSVALENYRRVRSPTDQRAELAPNLHYCARRLAIMDGGLYCCRSRAARCRRGSISITIMDAL